MCIFTTLPDSPEIWIHSCVCSNCLSPLLGPVCALHLIRSRNGRMSDLAQSGLETRGAAEFECFMESGAVNCGFPRFQPVFEGVGA